LVEIRRDKRRDRADPRCGRTRLRIRVRHALGGAAAAGGGLHHCVGIIFGEGGGGIRKLAFVGLGIAIMFAAVSFFLDFFGFAGGAVL
jgi:type IV secretory pathway VirB2 component (pilin)